VDVLSVVRLKHVAAKLNKLEKTIETELCRRKALTLIQTLTVVLYHQEQCCNGTRIKEEPKDEETEEPHERRLEG
jgi:hypothetical protein